MTENAKTEPAHPRLTHRKTEGVATRKAEHTGFNGWLAITITDAVARCGAPMPSPRWP